jgi:hypothetical protein
MKTENAGEQVAKKASSFAQGRAFGLDAPQLLEECKGYDLRIRKLFEGCVLSPFRVETSIGVVYETEQDSDRLFQEGELWGMLGEGHLLLLCSGSQMAFVLSHQTTQHSSSDRD